VLLGSHSEDFGASIHDSSRLSPCIAPCDLCCLQGVELLDHKRAAELLEKAKKDAEAELKRLAEREALKDKKQDKDNEAAVANQKKKSAMRQGGIPPGDFMLEGFAPAGGAAGWGAAGIQSWLGSQHHGAQVEPEEEVAKDTSAPEDAVFETLNDGSTALLVSPGPKDHRKACCKVTKI